MPTYTIHVHASEKSDRWGDIVQAVKTANGLQTEFHFQICPDCPHAVAKRFPGGFTKFKKRTREELPEEMHVLFSDDALDGVLVSEDLPQWIHVSCRVSPMPSAPPFRLYLIYQLASAAVTLAARLPRETNRGMLHEPPIGCLWDWWTNADERSGVMVAARICPTCQTVLLGHGGLSEVTLSATQQLLEFVRRSMMGERPEIANRIFIAYGHGDDWKVLVDLLTKWGLEVEYFNREAVAGLTVVERWRQMLNRARFAFAVMTPDDDLDGGGKRARQNVIHEIGLCHARLGIRNTAILKATGTEEFTNADGINYISFTAGNLNGISGEIEKLLYDRGILPLPALRE